MNLKTEIESVEAELTKIEQKESQVYAALEALNRERIEAEIREEEFKKSKQSAVMQAELKALREIKRATKARGEELQRLSQDRELEKLEKADREDAQVSVQDCKILFSSLREAIAARKRIADRNEAARQRAYAYNARTGNNPYASAPPTGLAFSSKLELRGAALLGPFLLGEISNLDKAEEEAQTAIARIL